MRADVSLLFETVFQWVHLETDALLLHTGDAGLAAQTPLESRIISLMQVLCRRQGCGDRRRLRVVLPASEHPIHRCWDSGASQGTL